MDRIDCRIRLLLAAALLAGPAAAQAPPDGAADDAGQLRGARNALIQAGDYAAALSPAEQAVAAARPSGGPRLYDDLLHLARVEAELDLYEEAELHYLEAAELAKDANGEFSPALLRPYQGLGRTYIKNRNFPAAITVLEQAQHISQRASGLYNMEQTPLIDDITTAHLGMGDTLAARRLQQERLDNAIRQYGADDPRVIPFRYHLADYYERSRLRLSALEQYEAVLETQEQQYGGADGRLLEPLREILRIELGLGRDEHGAAERIEQILSLEPDIRAPERGLALAALGDWALAAGQVPAAHGRYLAAYDALAAEDPAAAEETFAAPLMLDFIPPLNEVDRNERRRPYAWGDIVLRFDLSPAGTPSNVRTVSISPPGRIESAYRQRVREAHFRPRLVAGRAVATENVELEHAFRYYVDD